MIMKARRVCLFLIGALLVACGTTDSRVSDPLPAPTGPLVVIDRGGSRHDLDALLAEGQPVALIFWQTWCQSCIEEAPQLVQDSRAFGDRIAFFGVIPGPDKSVDEEAVDRAVAQFGFPHPQIRDRDLALTKRFGIEGTPTILVLGREREILYRAHELPSQQDWERLAR